MTTQQDIDSITPAEAMEYLRAIAPGHYKELLDWGVACYWRGILTQSEALDGRTGATTPEELTEDIEVLKVRCAQWIAS